MTTKPRFSSVFQRNCMTKSGIGPKSKPKKDRKVQAISDKYMVAKYPATKKKGKQITLLRVIPTMAFNSSHLTIYLANLTTLTWQVGKNILNKPVFFYIWKHKLNMLVPPVGSWIPVFIKIRKVYKPRFKQPHVASEELDDQSNNRFFIPDDHNVIIWLQYLEVSWNGVLPNNPQINHFNGILPYKPSILGYPHL